MYRFLIVIEKANGNYSAYCPDLPGCVATGRTREEADRNMHEAVEMHVQGLREDHIPVPKQQLLPNTLLLQCKSHRLPRVEIGRTCARRQRYCASCRWGIRWSP
jgi:predicted RNase H-like HicB family nuclease